MSIDPHNTFRPNDAFEYVDAYRAGIAMSLEALEARRRDLDARMKDDSPSYLLAAFRGYEDAYVFKTRQILPGVVKLNDLDPTPCESLTPAGYQFMATCPACRGSTKSESGGVCPCCQGQGQVTRERDNTLASIRHDLAMRLAGR